MPKWLEHFTTVFNSGNNKEESDVERCERSSGKHPPDIESLDCPISEEEVAESIRKLKHGKANRLDNVLAEMLKSAGTLLIAFLTKYLNEIFRSGSYPDMWTKAVIAPIHKKGDTNVTDNYRMGFVTKPYREVLYYHSQQEII